MTKINLTLDSDGRWLIQQLSTDGVAAIITASLIPADNILTYIFRLPRVTAHDIPASSLPDDAAPATNGGPIDFTVANHPIAWATMALTAGVTAANVYLETKKQKRALANGSYRSIFGAISAFEQKVLQEKYDKIKKLIENPAIENNYDDLTNYLRDAFQLDAEQQNAYVQNLKIKKARTRLQAEKKGESHIQQLATEIAEEALRQYEFKQLGGYLEVMLANDAELQKKYKTIKLNPETNQIEFDLYDQDEIHDTDTLENIIKKTARRAIRTNNYDLLKRQLREKLSLDTVRQEAYVKKLHKQREENKEEESIDKLTTEFTDEVLRDALPDVIKSVAERALTDNDETKLGEYLQKTFQLNAIQQKALAELLNETLKKQSKNKSEEERKQLAAAEFSKLIMRKSVVDKIFRGLDGLTRKFFGPLYGGLGISSYIYWIAWMSAGIFTGQFMTGIFGLSAGIMFGVPLLLGALYPIFKMINWARKKRFRENQNLAANEEIPATDDQVNTAIVDANRLFREAMQRFRFDAANQKLISELGGEYKPGEVKDPLLEQKIHESSKTLENQVAYLGKEIKRKTALDFISQLVGGYVGVQYASWIIGDIVMVARDFGSVIPIVNMVVGIGLFVLSGIRAIYNTIVNYRDRAKLAEEVKVRQAFIDKQRAHGDTLEDVFRVKQDQINAMKVKLSNAGFSIELPPRPVEYDRHEFLLDVKRSGPDEHTNMKKILSRAMIIFNAFMTGAFIARIFFVAKTITFLPFVAVAAGPYTLPVILFFGLGWAALQYYKYCKDRKEAYAKETLNKYEERIKCLQEEIHHADLKLLVLQKHARDCGLSPSISSASTHADEKKTERTNANTAKLSSVPVTATPSATTIAPDNTVASYVIKFFASFRGGDKVSQAKSSGVPLTDLKQNSLKTMSGLEEKTQTAFSN